MDAPTIDSTQGTEGQGTTPVPPQGTEPGTQVPVQHQDVSVQSVELNDNATSQDSQKEANFETARWMKRVERQMRSMQTAFEKSQQSAAPQGSPQTQPLPQITNDDVVKDPAGAMKRMIQEALQGFKTEIPQHIQQVNERQQQEQVRQDALRMIKTNAHVKTDPEGIERMQDILTEEDDFGNSLEKYSHVNPIHAAQLALKEYQSRFGNGKRSQSAPTKAQMQTTATAVSPGMPKGNSEQEAKEFYRQVIERPELMQNPEFLKKYAAFQEKASMEKLAQGK